MVQFNRAPGSVHAPAASPVGISERRRFIAQLHAIVGGTGDAVRLLWIANPADTTSSTTADKDGKTITWDATVASRFTAQGFGVVQTFDGTDDEGDISPDSADLSFNDAGSVAMSIVVLANVTNTAAARTFIAKWDLTTSSELREYQFVVASDDTLSFSTYDESANVATVRASDAAISMGAQHLYAVTYDGAGGATAGNTMALYEDGAAIASTATNNGSYVAMEDTDTIVRIAAIENASGVAADFMAGNMGMILVTATELNADQNWAIKEAVNAYYGLTL